MTPAKILGAHFRPPAKLIFQYLPSDQSLVLEPEPENPYDANAIKVMLQSSNLPTDSEFIDNLQSYGHDLEALQANALIHLGYIERGRTSDFTHVSLVTLSFDSKGQPLALPSEEHT